MKRKTRTEPAPFGAANPPETRQNSDPPRAPTQQGEPTPAQTERRTIQIDAYQPHPRNYNRHPEDQVKRIAHSLTTFGQVKSIVVWRGYFLAGHGVAEAARSLGWTTLQADVLPDDYPEIKALAYLAADNELSRLSDPDAAQLAAILQEARAEDAALMAAIGYDDAELQKLLRDAEKQRAAGEPSSDDPTEQAAELLEKWRVRTGDLWQLGRHRLLCGDSTDPAAIDRLLDGKRAALLVTDPPYNVGIDYGEDSDDDKSDQDYEQFTRAWFDAWAERSDRQIVTPGFNNLMLWSIMYRRRIKQIAPWIKTNAVTRGYISAHACWEPILFFGEADPAWEPILFLQNDKKQAGWNRIRVNDVFNYPIGTQPHTGGHPAPKPLAMWQDMINSYTLIDDLVCDSFGGSGTTIIAAERMIRRAAAMEISPQWCSVILERYQIETGDTPTLISRQPAKE